MPGSAARPGRFLRMTAPKVRSIPVAPEAIPAFDSSQGEGISEFADGLQALLRGGPEECL